MKPKQRRQDADVPRAALYGAGLLVGFVLFGSAAYVWTTPKTGPRPVSTAAVEASRDLAFRAGPMGAVTAWDVRENRAVRHMMPGEGGFIRGVLRNFAQSRQKSALGEEAPFRLTAFADGRLQIQDLATGRIIDLGAFGPVNEHAFASLLSAKGESS